MSDPTDQAVTRPAPDVPRPAQLNAFSELLSQPGFREAWAAANNVANTVRDAAAPVVNSMHSDFLRWGNQALVPQPGGMLQVDGVRLYVDSAGNFRIQRGGQPLAPGSVSVNGRDITAQLNAAPGSGETTDPIVRPGERLTLNGQSHELHMVTLYGTDALRATLGLNADFLRANPHLAQPAPPSISTVERQVADANRPRVGVAGADTPVGAPEAPPVVARPGLQTLTYEQLLALPANEMLTQLRGMSPTELAALTSGQQRAIGRTLSAEQLAGLPVTTQAAVAAGLERRALQTLMGVSGADGARLTPEQVRALGFDARMALVMSIAPNQATRLDRDIRASLGANLTFAQYAAMANTWSGVQAMSPETHVAMLRNATAEQVALLDRSARYMLTGSVLGAASMNGFTVDARVALVSGFTVAQLDSIATRGGFQSFISGLTPAQVGDLLTRVPDRVAAGMTNIPAETTRTLLSTATPEQLRALRPAALDALMRNMNATQVSELMIALSGRASQLPPGIADRIMDRATGSALNGLPGLNSLSWLSAMSPEGMRARPAVVETLVNNLSVNMRTGVLTNLSGDQIRALEPAMRLRLMDAASPSTLSALTAEQRIYLMRDIPAAQLSLATGSAEARTARGERLLALMNGNGSDSGRISQTNVDDLLTHQQREQILQSLSPEQIARLDPHVANRFIRNLRPELISGLSADIRSNLLGRMNADGVAQLSPQRRAALLDQLSAEQISRIPAANRQALLAGAADVTSPLAATNVSNLSAEAKIALAQGLDRARLTTTQINGFQASLNEGQRLQLEQALGPAAGTAGFTERTFQLPEVQALYAARCQAFMETLANLPAASRQEALNNFVRDTMSDLLENGELQRLRAVLPEGMRDPAAIARSVQVQVTGRAGAPALVMTDRSGAPLRQVNGQFLTEANAVVRPADVEFRLQVSRNLLQSLDLSTVEGRTALVRLQSELFALQGGVVQALTNERVGAGTTASQAQARLSLACEQHVLQQLRTGATGLGQVAAAPAGALDVRAEARFNTDGTVTFEGRRMTVDQLTARLAEQAEARMASERPAGTEAHVNAAERAGRVARLREFCRVNGGRAVPIAFLLSEAIRIFTH